jgi:hypothetical protein
MTDDGQRLSEADIKEACLLLDGPGYPGCRTDWPVLVSIGSVIIESRARD